MIQDGKLRGLPWATLFRCGRTIPPARFAFQATSRSCSSRHARPNSTAKNISGSSCGRTGCRTEFSNPSTTSSITAATPGTRSSISRGKSCPSRAAIGQPQVTQSEDWYNSTRNGRVHRAGFKTREPPSGVGVPSRPLIFSLWRAPLAEITRTQISFRGTPEQLQVIWHQSRLLSGVVLDRGARDLQFARGGLIAHGVARLAPSRDGVKYDLY